MTIEQTIDIPANRVVTIRLPETVPCGKQAVILDFPAAPTEHKLQVLPKRSRDREPRMTAQEALARVQALCADVQFSVDDLLEDRRRDLEREKE